MAGRGETVLAPQMATVWGGAERWGLEASTDNRWRTLLDSGCAEGREVRLVLETLTEEYAASQGWLESGLEGALGASIEGIGDGSVSGETRGHIMECLENSRAKVLVKALEEVRPRSTRASWSWRQ